MMALHLLVSIGPKSTKESPSEHAIYDEPWGPNDISAA
jgi:hypothetical protein